MLFSPTVDVVEKKKALKVTAELPGLKEKDIDVELTRDSLILRGEKSEETEEKEDTFFRKERRFGSFERVIPLPWEVDPAEIQTSASFKKGVLKITVPKPENLPETVKRIPIASN